MANIDHFAAMLGKRNVTSIFFGGGTPSRLPAPIVGRLIDAIARHWSLVDNVEITLEANPSQAGSAKFQGLRSAGVNRLSIGVQSLDDHRLRFLGRKHSAADAVRAVDHARTIFPRMSFDLIYATPEQSPAAWEAELNAALKMASNHLSCYQLTIEPNTPFYRQWQAGRLIPIAHDHAGQLYRLTDEILSDKGWRGYEISNHARDNDLSLHNLNYWRYGDYLGLGPGAHSRVQWQGKSLALRQTAEPNAWMKDMLENRNRTGFCRTLPSAESAAEMLMMGLRLDEGIDRKRFLQRCGMDIARFVDPSALRRFQNSGWLTLDRQRLRASHQGRMLLDSLLCDLLPDEDAAEASPSPESPPESPPESSTTSFPDSSPTAP